MSVLDSSVAQIIGTKPDEVLRRAYIDYITAQPKAVRDAYLTPDDVTTGDPSATRQAALEALGQGWPGRLGSYQIDPDVMIGTNPLVAMQLRAQAGEKWRPAVGMQPIQASSTGIAMPDPNNMPDGAIPVVLSWPTPSDDLIVPASDLGWIFTRAPGSDPNGQGFVQGTDPRGVGSTYWPAVGVNDQELSVLRGPGDAVYQLLSVLALHPSAAAEMVFVRLK